MGNGGQHLSRPCTSLVAALPGCGDPRHCAGHAQLPLARGLQVGAGVAGEDDQGRFSAGFRQGQGSWDEAENKVGLGQHCRQGAASGEHP